MKIRIKPLLLSFFAMLAFFSCIGFYSCTSYELDPTKKIFYYNESADIASLDPAFAKDQAMIWANLQLFNGLVQLDSNLDVRPSIASSWQISDDGLIYSFALRNDVFFHPHHLFSTNNKNKANEASNKEEKAQNKGRRLVADDFTYSFKRILDPKVASPGVWIFNLVDTFYSVNDTVFNIELKQPFSPFLGLLSMPYASVVPREIVEHYGDDFRKNPIGTGPFYFKLWKEGVKLVLLKNEHYFEKDDKGGSLPYLDAVNISFIIDKQSVFLEFVKGNIDFISGIDPNYKDEILTRSGSLQPKYKDRIKLVTKPYLNTEYLGFMLDESLSAKSNPLLNKKIRQAINYGFDRKNMIKYLRNNIGEPGEKGIIPMGLPGYDAEAKGYNYNPQKAKELLSEAGYPNGQGLGSITLNTTSSYLDLCKYIQAELGLLGLDVKIDVNPPAALRQQIAESKSMWFRASWIADYPDSENYLSLFYSKNFCPQGPNYTHFKDEQYDKLYQKSQKETDPQKREQLYKEMNNILIEEAPIIVLYYDQVLRFVQKNIEGLHTNAQNQLVLKYVEKQ